MIINMLKTVFRALARWVRRRPPELKGKVLQVGAATIIEDGKIHVDGWAFDCSNGAVCINIISDTEIHLAGYSTNELREIVARRCEWEDA